MRYSLVAIFAVMLCGCALRQAAVIAPSLPEVHHQETVSLLAGLRWETLAGVGISAIGAAMMWYLGKYLGGGVAIMGAVIAFGSMTVSAIAPYWDYIVWSGIAVSLIAAGIHFRRYIAAAFHLAHGTEHLASAGEKALIGKIRSSGPSVFTRLRAIIHHAPISTVQTVTTNPTRTP